MADRRLLWADDEIEMLKPHLLFLRERGYDVHAVTSGEDAVKAVAREEFDAVLLDEQMAGLDGIATLQRVKRIRPGLPVVMITKSEEESLMEEAIGRRIDDYLTKPVNPSQILSVLKRLLDTRSISQERLNRDYVAEFNRINDELDSELDWDDWLDLGLRLQRWAIDISAMRSPDLMELLDQQMHTANNIFSRYIEREYPRWLKQGREDRPPLSHDVVREWVVPRVSKGEPVLFLVLDCLRLDHWLAVEPLLRDQFQIELDTYFSLLPTATPYSRNSIFSGMLPIDYPRVNNDLYSKLKWDSETNVNRFERQLLDRQLTNMGAMPSPEPKYAKILDPEEAQRTLKKASDYFDLPLVSMVFNFVDIVAHHRSTEEVIQTLIPDEAAYRSVVRSWFEHSPLYELMRTFVDRGVTIVLTSDHGSIRARRAAKVIGDREASTNLRYKTGRNLRVDDKHSVRVREPERWGIPKSSLNEDLLLAREDYYFVYPTDFNKYADRFRDSFLHGGISLEEMVLPVAVLKKKAR
ncbi:bifunctional response regulator/alkaline phosphatase family protein [bacterium]|nr:bifunctional response regulator/alkaline phosphatase family protein [bacterium]